MVHVQAAHMINIYELGFDATNNNHINNNNNNITSICTANKININKNGNIFWLKYIYVAQVCELQMAKLLIAIRFIWNALYYK